MRFGIFLIPPGVREGLALGNRPLKTTLAGHQHRNHGGFVLPLQARGPGCAHRRVSAYPVIPRNRVWRGVDEASAIGRVVFWRNVASRLLSAGRAKSVNAALWPVARRYREDRECRHGQNNPQYPVLKHLLPQFATHRTASVEWDMPSRLTRRKPRRGPERVLVLKDGRAFAAMQECLDIEGWLSRSAAGRASLRNLCFRFFFLCLTY